MCMRKSKSKKPSSIFDIKGKPLEEFLSRGFREIRLCVHQHLKARIAAGYDEHSIKDLEERFDSWLEELKNTPRDPGAN